MTVDRPTFSESWYRVAALTPRLHPAVDVYGQHFRGRKWYVLQNPGNNQFFRLSEAAYHFVAILDGCRNVDKVWHICLDKYGDAAPTQGEVVSVLGQLYASNLLQGNLTMDAETLFRRYQKRIQREVKGWFMSFLSIRIPVFDPDRAVDLRVGLVGKVFTWCGGLLWLGIVGAGLCSVASRMHDLSAGSSMILNPANLPLLYLGLLIVKVFHEMGHAFSCKHFGKQSGTSGEVHEMGITFLLFTPLPYIDASSAWALKNKWHRVVVGASGMLVELAVAAVAAILWSRTAEGETIHIIAYNIMFVAGVSTLLFNGNPLLRYDAYYILLDVLEIPNLYSRSRSYVYFLVKRYLWGMVKTADPSHAKGEKIWLTLYASGSMICRVIVTWAIILFVGDRLFIAGVIFGLAIFVVYIVAPLAKLFRYLATNRELERVRGRAIATSFAVIATLLITVGLVSAPDRFRIEGVLEPAEMAVIYAKTDGFVLNYLDSGAKTSPHGAPVIEARNPELETQRDCFLAEMRQLQARRNHARTREALEVQIMDEKIAALSEQIERTEKDLNALSLKPSLPGTWVAPDIEQIKGMYTKRGQRIGVVVNLNNPIIRAVAGQKVAALLIKEARPQVKIRVKGRPDIELIGRIEVILPAGHERLPSEALGYASGGITQIDIQDTSGKRAAEPFFEIRVVPSLVDSAVMRPGQVMVLQIETPPKPLIAQGWRSLQQLFQRRFQI